MLVVRPQQPFLTGADAVEEMVKTEVAQERMRLLPSMVTVVEFHSEAGEIKYFLSTQ